MFNIPTRIRELCEQKKIKSIYELAKITGIRQSSLQDIVSGDVQNPRTDTIERICEGLGITLPEFFSPTAYEVKEDSPEYYAILDKIKKDKEKKLAVSEQTIKKLINAAEEIKKEIAED